MGKTFRGIRDGTGPYEDSYRMKVAKNPIGTRQEEGEECPVKVKKVSVWR